MSPRDDVAVLRALGDIPLRCCAACRPGTCWVDRNNVEWHPGTVYGVYAILPSGARFFVHLDTGSGAIEVRPSP